MSTISGEQVNPIDLSGGRFAQLNPDVTEGVSTHIPDELDSEKESRSPEYANTRLYYIEIANTIDRLNSQFFEGQPVIDIRKLNSLCAAEVIMGVAENIADPNFTPQLGGMLKAKKGSKRIGLVERTQTAIENETFSELLTKLKEEAGPFLDMFVISNWLGFEYKVIYRRVKEMTLYAERVSWQFRVPGAAALLLVDLGRVLTIMDANEDTPYGQWLREAYELGQLQVLTEVGQASILTKVWDEYINSNPKIPTDQKKQLHWRNLF